MNPEKAEVKPEEEPKPCPFCGVSNLIADKAWNEWIHPKNQCWLSGYSFMLEVWNTRTPDLERVEIRLSKNIENGTYSAWLKIPEGIGVEEAYPIQPTENPFKVEKIVGGLSISLNEMYMSPREKELQEFYLACKDNQREEREMHEDALSALTKEKEELLLAVKKALDENEATKILTVRIEELKSQLREFEVLEVTPKDVEVLRKANTDLAQENFEYRQRMEEEGLCVDCFHPYISHIENVCYGGNWQQIKSCNCERTFHLFRASKQKRPKIVCLCGSTKFFKEFQEASLRETLDGKIVLSIGCNLREDRQIWADEKERDAIKIRLDELHKRKIDLADEVLVLNVGGYIGSSTRSEIEYATAQGKPVRYLESGADRKEGER